MMAIYCILRKQFPAVQFLLLCYVKNYIELLLFSYALPLKQLIWNAGRKINRDFEMTLIILYVHSCSCNIRNIKTLLNLE